MRSRESRGPHASSLPCTRSALRPDCHPLPDHAAIDPRWLQTLPGRWILMTAKDAVKCRRFDGGLLARCVRVDVAATPEPALLEWLAARLRAGR